MKTIVNILIAALISGFLLQGCATTQVNKPADALYQDGEQYFEQGNYEDAIAQWKRVKESYQSQELTTRAELGIADAYYLNKDYIEASAAYEDFRKLHPSHERAEYALYRQGLSNYFQVNRIDTDQTPVKNALTVFESYLKAYPAGQHAAEVREKIRECRDKQIQYEIYVGRFYLSNENYPAAIGRFEEALKAFPEQPRRDELLYYLGLSYLESGQKSKGREVFGRLTREYTGSRYINQANKAMDKFF